ncbi:hypothetical protein SAY87_024411 [Trapa incisa]|uniref:adenine phosphoribosyltransferase n=1 Tax=Trapa incisa TaxID=236973 RepID=A0AAN7GJV0_9MYRT|nr:hypothetical protein SAY87_024411 [Trapa incisa]
MALFRAFHGVEITLMRLGLGDASRQRLLFPVFAWILLLTSSILNCEVNGQSIAAIRRLHPLHRQVDWSIQAASRVEGTNKIGEDSCAIADIRINQGLTDPLPNGIPTYTVEIVNMCATGCSILDIHVSCGWFSSAKLINPRIFRRLSYNDCIVNDGKPLANDKFGAGIMFQDIARLLLDASAFKDTVDLFVQRYKDKSISVVAGIEARGFIFGPPIALTIGAKFVPLRIPGKLLDAVKPDDRVLVTDDLVATVGTLCLKKLAVEIIPDAKRIYSKCHLVSYFLTGQFHYDSSTKIFIR